MSIEALNWALSVKTGSSSAKSVLLILANRANHQGTCYPGVEGIAEQTEISSRQVIRMIQKLEQLGLIEVIHRGGSGSGRKSNLYQLKMGQCDTVSLRGNVTSEQGNVTSGQGLSDTLSPEPKENPKKNPQNGVPPSLNKSAWSDYLSHRSEIRAKRLTPRGQQMAMKGLAKLSHNDQQRTVDLTISNGWQGLFPEKIQNEKTRPGNARPKTVEEIHAGLRAKAGLE